MLHVIIQIVLLQGLFLLVYDLFLKRETFFNYNRLYLVFTLILSLVLPFISFDILKDIAPKNYIVVLPELMLGQPVVPTTIMQTEVLEQVSQTVQPAIQLPIWQLVMLTGALVIAISFGVKYLKLVRLKSKNPKEKKGAIVIVKLLQSNTAFSFFNTIFLGDKISIKDQPTILKHELVHVTHYHTIDVILIELLKIGLWFSPFVYMYGSRIKAVHEFIADAHVVKQTSKKRYYEQLLNQVFETKNISFVNSFFNTSLIKKRIVMLQKSKSKKIKALKFTLCIPVIIVMLIYTSATSNAQQTETITETLQTQDLDEKALIAKYIKEFKGYPKKELLTKMAGFADSEFDKFKMSLDQFAKYRAFIKVYMIDEIYKPKVKKGTATETDLELLKKLEINKTYKEYLAETKTKDYQQRWESRVRNGVYRLFVKDLANKTQEEQKRFQEKIDLIEKDDYWFALLITDGNSETLMEFNKTKNGITEVVEVEEIKSSVEVPFSVIDNPPIFKTCKDVVGNKERKSCTSNEIGKFININFNKDLPSQLGLTGRQRISVIFKIDTQGNVREIGARAPHPALETEAKRVIAQLPKMIPGTQSGKPVVVPYSLPIIFNVASNSKAKD